MTPSPIGTTSLAIHRPVAGWAGRGGSRGAVAALPPILGPWCGAPTTAAPRGATCLRISRTASIGRQHRPVGPQRDLGRHRRTCSRRRADGRRCVTGRPTAAEAGGIWGSKPASRCRSPSVRRSGRRVGRRRAIPSCRTRNAASSGPGTEAPAGAARAGDRCVGRRLGSGARRQQPPHLCTPRSGHTGVDPVDGGARTAASGRALTVATRGRASAKVCRS